MSLSWPTPVGPTSIVILRRMKSHQMRCLFRTCSLLHLHYFIHNRHLPLCRHNTSAQPCFRALCIGPALRRHFVATASWHYEVDTRPRSHLASVQTCTLPSSSWNCCYSISRMPPFVFVRRSRIGAGERGAFVKIKSRKIDFAAKKRQQQLGFSLL